MNQELEKVKLWVAANKLSLNVGKIIIFMIFKSKTKNVPKYKTSRSHKVLRGIHRRKIALVISH